MAGQYKKIPIVATALIERVATFGDLPTGSGCGLSPGAVRYVDSLKEIYQWDGTDWTLIGANTLDQLDDVDTSTTPPSDGDVLIYDGGSGIWAPNDSIPLAGASSQLCETYDCDAGAAVNDIVRFSSTTAGKVEVLTSNTYDDLAIGVIKEKPTATRATVVFTGLLTGFTGLSQGKTLFVGPSGAITTTPPTSGQKQIMGFAASTTSAVIAPERNKATLL